MIPSRQACLARYGYFFLFKRAFLRLIYIYIYRVTHCYWNVKIVFAQRVVQCTRRADVRWRTIRLKRMI